MKKNRINIIVLALFAVLLGVSCNKDYFEDTGIHDPNFKGNMMEYLDSKGKVERDIFDTLVQVIRYAGLEETFKKDDFTFFAPGDPCIQLAIRNLNVRLASTGQDTITSFKSVKPIVWKEILEMYMIPGTYSLIDFEQVDLADIQSYGGRLYQTKNENELINVGLVYHDLVNGDVTVKYGGARQVLVSYIPDLNTNGGFWYSTYVASSNIKPTNGIVHVLNYNAHILGFMYDNFTNKAIENDIDYDND